MKKYSNPLRVLITILFCTVHVVCCTPVVAVDLSQVDKQEHFLAGCAISSMVRSMVNDSGKEDAAAWGIGAGVSVGVLKELYDKPHKASQSFDGQDSFATNIGALACVSFQEGVAFVVGKNSLGVKVKF